MFGDTLYFSAIGANATTITTIGFSIHIDGSLSGYADGSPCCHHIGSGFALGAFFFTVGNQVYSLGNVNGFNATTSNIVTTGSMNRDWSGEPAIIDEDFSGTFSFIGPTGTAAIFMELVAGGQNQFADFSNTATFSFDPLPVGVSFTSASGDFLTAAETPIPATLSLFAGGVGLLGLALCRGRSPNRVKTRAPN
jgi:hypothetical protein